MCIRDRAYSGQTLKWDEAINSNQVLGPPSDQMYWDLKFSCLLYTSDAADERSSVDLGGRRIIKKKKNKDKA